MLWYVTLYCYHFSVTNREESGLHFEGPSAPYSWNLRIHWNRLFKWKRHFISRLSSGCVCMSTSPSADCQSDPSGETARNGVLPFRHSPCRHLPHKNVRPGNKTGIIFSNNRRNDIDLVCASILHSLVWWCFVQSFSNVRPHSSKNVSNTSFLF